MCVRACVGVYVGVYVWVHVCARACVCVWGGGGVSVRECVCVGLKHENVFVSVCISRHERFAFEMGFIL